jgi:hypothetical protein
MAEIHDETNSTILLVIGLLVLLGLVGTMVYNSKKTTTTELCRISVIAKAAASKATLGAAGFLDLNCETDRVVIKSDYVYDNEGKEKISSFSGATKQDKIKKIIAEKGRDCWYQFSKGEFDITAVFGNPSSGEEACIVCSEIAFDSSIRKEFPELVNFSGWLSNNTMDGTEQTYSEYFQDAAQFNNYYRERNNFYKPELSMDIQC